MWIDRKMGDTTTTPFPGVTGVPKQDERRCADWENTLVTAICNAVGVQQKTNHPFGALSLRVAKSVLEALETKAMEMGLSAVLAICNAAGNPIAVHVMDDSLLVSFDVAVGKAYTAVAVKMPTEQLYQLAQPGQMFYGIESLHGGKLVAIGGGIPLYHPNGTLLGGLGVSGGTSEQDIMLATFGLEIVPTLLGGDQID